MAAKVNWGSILAYRTPNSHAMQSRDVITQVWREASSTAGAPIQMP